MNAKQIADELENIYWIQGDGKGKPFQQYADFVRQQQAEIEALKNGFNTTWAGTNNSEMAEVRAMANRCILKIQELEFEQEGFENLVEMLESEKEELVEKTRQQQAEIEALKTCLIVEQEHNELMVEDRSKYEALAHAGGVEVGKELKTLTDEEIIETVKDHFIGAIKLGIVLTNDNVLSFARAILRKAQEK